MQNNITVNSQHLGGRHRAVLADSSSVLVVPVFDNAMTPRLNSSFFDEFLDSVSYRHVLQYTLKSPTDKDKTYIDESLRRISVYFLTVTSPHSCRGRARGSGLILFHSYIKKTLDHKD